MIKYLIGLLGGIIGLLGIKIAADKRALDKANLEAFKAKRDSDDKEQTQKISIAKVTTETAKENYEKAMADLPGDDKPASGLPAGPSKV